MINVGTLTRPYTVTSLYEAVMYAGINPFSFFGLTIANCPNMEKPGGCDDLWLESSIQGEKSMNRQAFVFALLEAEQKLADYLGYWPGPKYIENERRFIGHWNKIITTKYGKVVRTGTRKRERIARGDMLQNPNITQTPTSIQKILNVGAKNYFGALLGPMAIGYRFGLPNGPDLNIPDNCNLLLYPEGMDDEIAGSGAFADPDVRVNEGYIMRPYTVIKREPEPPQTTKVLEIHVPIFSAIRPIRWMRNWPNKQNITKALDVCDPNNWTDTVALYRETFEKPDGFATISRRDCRKCGGAGECTECVHPKLPICLIPLDSDAGKFKVQPLRKTTIAGKECYVPDDLESCCGAMGQGYDSGVSFNYRWTYQCFCTKPLEICYNYVSSCNDCFGPDCISQHVCPELLPALVKITLANLPVLCKCECVHQIIDRLRHPYMTGRDNAMVVYSDKQFSLGSKVGEVEAWESIRHKEWIDRSVALL